MALGQPCKSRTIISGLILRGGHVSALVPTSGFVLLWSSGAIVSEIGIRHGSSLALLILRYAVAFLILVTFAV